jgi:hypothetical protein
MNRKTPRRSLPSYETQADKANEAIAQRVLEQRGYSVFSFGRYSPCDFFIFKDGQSFFTEYKRRNHNYNTYPTVIMPEKKLRQLLSVAEKLSSKVLYVAHFNDGVYAAVVEDYHTELGGRKDRGDPRDTHRVAHININNFKQIG